MNKKMVSGKMVSKIRFNLVARMGKIVMKTIREKVQSVLQLHKHKSKIGLEMKYEITCYLKMATTMY